MVDYFTADQITHISASEVRLDFLVVFEFLTETIRVWNGHTQFEDLSGNIYLPLYGTMQLELPQFATGTAADQITVGVDGMLGLDIDLLSTILSSTTEVMGRSLRVYMQLFDENWQPKYAPIAHAWGYMQPPKISRVPMTELQGATERVSISATNVFSGRALNSAARLTDRDQKIRFPGDKFCEFIPGLINKTVTYPDY